MYYELGVDSDCDGSDDDVAASADDTAGTIKIDGGCGCATGAPQGAALGLLLAGLALTARRRGAPDPVASALR